MPGWGLALSRSQKQWLQVLGLRRSGRRLLQACEAVQVCSVAECWPLTRTARSVCNRLHTPATQWFNCTGASSKDRGVRAQAECSKCGQVRLSQKQMQFRLAGCKVLPAGRRCCKTCEAVQACRLARRCRQAEFVEVVRARRPRRKGL